MANKEVSLKKQYEEINEALAKTAKAREKIFEACAKLNEEIDVIEKNKRLHQIAESIMKHLTKISYEVSEFNVNRGTESLKISTTYSIECEREMFKGMDWKEAKEELQKILDNFSPEKLEVVGISSRPVYNYTIIKVALI